VVMGVDRDLPCSLSPELRLSYAGAAEVCGANMLGGADGEGGRIDGVSVFTGTSLPGDLGCGSTIAAVAIFLSSFPNNYSAVKVRTNFAVIDVSEMVAYFHPLFALAKYEKEEPRGK
jgi:hypothetical protein